MPTIIFIKDGQQIPVTNAQTGQSVLQTALTNNIAMDHACGGNGVCTTCMVKVHEGADNLGQVTDQEEMMGMDPDDNSTRLGCQTQISGDATVELAF